MKGLIRNVNHRNFFSFSYQCFQQFDFFQNVTCLLQHVILSCPHWGNAKMPKHYEISSMLKLIFLQKYRAEKFHRSFERKFSTQGKLFPEKTISFAPCIRRIIIQNLKNLQLIKFHLDMRKLVFLLVEVWLLPSSVLNSKHSTYRRKFHWNTILAHHASESCMCKSYKKSLFYWFVSISEIIFPRIYRLDIFHLVLYRESYTFKASLIDKTLLLIFPSEFLIIANIKKKVKTFDILLFKNSFFWVGTNLTSPCVWLENLLFVKKDSTENFWFWALH